MSTTHTKKPPVFAVCLTRPQLIAVRRALIAHYASECQSAASDTHEGWDGPDYGEHVHDAWLTVTRIINSLP